MDPTGETSDDILPQIAPALKQAGCQLKKVSEIAEQKPEGVMKAIQRGLDKANEHAPSHAQKVR